MLFFLTAKRHSNCHCNCWNQINQVNNKVSKLFVSKIKNIEFNFAHCTAKINTNQFFFKVALSLKIIIISMHDNILSVFLDSECKYKYYLRSMKLQCSETSFSLDLSALFPLSFGHAYPYAWLVLHTYTSQADVRAKQEKESTNQMVLTHQCFRYVMLQALHHQLAQ